MPVRGSCQGDILVYKDGREHHDTLMGTMVMDDGLIVALSGGLANSRWGASWAIHGTHGTLESLGGHFRDCIVEGTKPIMDAASAGRTPVAALMLYSSSFDGERIHTREETEAGG